MENKLLNAIRRYEMIVPGDTVICAVSGGADSMALLWGMFLLKEKLGIRVCAAHFNHHLRGEESDRDEAFVREFCDRHDIPLYVGAGEIQPGKKGLEAAARDARYAFLKGLPGVIATAHTANDNTETVLMHLLRGSSLRGLGGITPKGDGLIRPMLDITRQEVEEFLADQWVGFVTDGSNASDRFLRNRIRHHVIPLLLQENPSLNENLSAMAQRLREDEAILAAMTPRTDSVEALRAMEPGLQRRSLEAFLQDSGVIEPESAHIEQLRRLVATEHPSAESVFPGDVIIRRNYGKLEAGQERTCLPTQKLIPGQNLILEEQNLQIHVSEETPEDEAQWIKVFPQGEMELRSRRSGDRITLSGGSKSLKKLFADRKIPAHLRMTIPVVADQNQVLYIHGIGLNKNQNTDNRPLWIKFENKTK